VLPSRETKGTTLSATKVWPAKSLQINKRPPFGRSISPFSVFFSPVPTAAACRNRNYSDFDPILIKPSSIGRFILLEFIWKYPQAKHFVNTVTSNINNMTLCFCLNSRYSKSFYF
jgi:hypothetical protein